MVFAKMSPAAGVGVSCSGAVLSSLLYEQLRSGHAQEGFLLGTVESHISEHISDSQICNEKMETTINVSSFLPCTMIGSFYSGVGELSNEKLSGFLGSSFQHVIGWYRCRGSICDELYMREILVHQQLSKIMTHTGGHFILGILSCTPSEDSGTFTVCHKFMMEQNKHFEGIALQVINMGDTSTDEYRLKPRNPALYNSGAVNSVLSAIKNCEPGVSEAENLHSGLLERLDSLLPRYANSQKDLHKILQEVTSLRMLCSNNDISLDFTPETYNLDDNQDLMDFEESSVNTSSQGTRGKGNPMRASLKKKNPGRGKNNKEENSTSDPFGFVNKEMEKLQVKGRGSPVKRISRSRTNTPSPGRLNKAVPGIENTPPRNSSESAGSHEGSPVSPNKRSKSRSNTPSQKDSQDVGMKERPKSVRTLTRTASKERNSPSRGTRSQGPSITNSRGNNRSAKTKKKEAWIEEKSDSGSQEF